MISSSEYKKRLSKLRRNVYNDAKLIDRENERLQGAVNVMAKSYDIQTDPEFKQYEDILTATSHLTGEKISRFNNIHQSIADLLAKQRMTRLVTQQVGGCAARCMGIDSTNALSVITYLADQKYGTEYNKRFLAWLKDFQTNDRTSCCAQTDVKGNRPQRPHEQKDLDLYLRVVEKKSDGIVVRGAKVHNSFAPVVEQINVIPTRALTKEEGDWAVAFNVPADAEGMKQIVSVANTYGPDGAVAYGGADSMTIFDNVFVPWDHVFLCGEPDMGGYLALLFALYHRHSYTGCKPAMTDIITGAVALMAEVNGIEKEGHVREKLSELICTSELCYGSGIAAAVNASKSPSGTMVPDIMYCNVSRRHAGLNIYHEYEILADIAGGMPATLPRPKDWRAEETRPFIEKYMARNPNVKVEDVLKAFYFVQTFSCTEAAG
jgi:4-hydroxyphenylacetate 3-monooxygenase/4-hydroxybutyryl-CoA dehydratase/vinylacetyl-CoA-Delta-isomerase